MQYQYDVSQTRIDKLLIHTVIIVLKRLILKALSLSELLKPTLKMCMS